MVVAACGVRPRVDLALASGLPVNRGIVVNDMLATEVPRVYAIGECAEHNGRTYGLVAPVWDQAAVLAEVLSGKQPPSRYHGSKLHARLKVAGVDVASMGLLEPELETDAVLQVVEDRRGAYRKLIVRGGRLVGAMLVGDTRAAAALVQAFDRDDPLPENPLEVLCVGWTPGTTACVSRLVCNCHKITEAAIGDAIAAGATSVQDVSASTLAGTGCGSCKTEIAQLVTRLARKPRLEVHA
jgi:nitrite reductase (NADH) large subunit